jgi:hypothetical protein
MKKTFAIMGTNTGSIAVARKFLLLSGMGGVGARMGGVGARMRRVAARKGGT